MRVVSALMDGPGRVTLGIHLRDTLLTQGRQSERLKSDTGPHEGDTSNAQTYTLARSTGCALSGACAIEFWTVCQVCQAEPFCPLTLMPQAPIAAAKENAHGRH